MNKFKKLSKSVASYLERVGEKGVKGRCQGVYHEPKVPQELLKK